MENIKKTLTLLSCLLISTFTFGDGNLTSLKVDSDIVYFSTDEEKIATSPSCMATENSDKWSLSLNTATGKAIYALLITVSADNRKITVESAGDCSDITSFERAKSVELGLSDAAYKPKIEDVAYGYRHYYNGKQSCTIHVNSNDTSGSLYLLSLPSSNGTSCSCRNGSKMTKTQDGNNSSSYYFKCVAAVK
jgi:hypothetical protein